MLLKNSIIYPAVPRDIIKNSIDIFRMFVNDDLVNENVRETNKYAIQQISKGHSSKSRIKYWNETNSNKILKFLGVFLTMDLVYDPFITDPMIKFFTTNLFPLLLHVIGFFCC